MNKNFDIPELAYSDIDAGLFKKSISGKYSYFLGVTSTGATGSAPEQIEKTVVGQRKKTYIPGKEDSPQRELGFYGHRDNYDLLEKNKNIETDFLQVNPDGTAFAFSGYIGYYQDDVTNGSTINAKMVITTTKPSTYIRNVYDLIEDTAYISSAVEDKIYIVGTGTKEINVVTIPSDATITAESDTIGVATVQVTSKKITITGVATGNSIIKITTTKSGCASRTQSFVVFVTE